MSAREFQEWRALNEIDPVDAEYRADVRVALLAATFANVTIGKNKQTGKPWSIGDFLLKHDPVEAGESRTKSPEAMLAMAQAITMRLGGGTHGELPASDQAGG